MSRRFKKQLAVLMIFVFTVQLFSPLSGAESIWADRRVVPVSPRASVLAKKTVIQIEDIHANVSAQKNIGEMLRLFVKEHNVDFIALEGAFGLIELESFKSYHDQPALRQAVARLTDEKKISGAMRAALAHRDFPTVIGIDDPEHYALNVQAVRESEKTRSILKERLVGERRKLAAEKHQIFNAELYSFDVQANAYADRQIPLGEYARFLETRGYTKYAAKKNLHLYLQALDLEKAFDVKRAERQRAQMLNSGHNDLSKFPDLKTYLDYKAASEQIDAAVLFQEIRSVEKSAYQRLVKNTRERELVQASRKLYLAYKLVGSMLSAQEWHEYQQDERVLEVEFKPFENFYREAMLRDQRMAQNVLTAMDKRGANVSVVVAGGYHTAGMKHIFEMNGINVITMTPKVASLESKEGINYLSTFSQNKTPFERLVRSEKLTLSPPQFPASIKRELALSTLAESGRSAAPRDEVLNENYQALCGADSGLLSLKGLSYSPDEVRFGVKNQDRVEIVLEYKKSSQESYLKAPEALPVMSIGYVALSSEWIYPTLLRHFGSEAPIIVRTAGFALLFIEIPVLVFAIGRLPAASFMASMVAFFLLHVLLETSRDTKFTRRAVTTRLQWNLLRLLIIAAYASSALALELAPTYDKWSMAGSIVLQVCTDANLIFGFGWGRIIAMWALAAWDALMIVSSPVIRPMVWVFEYFAVKFLSVERHVEISKWIYKYMLKSHPMTSHKIKLLNYLTKMLDPNNNARRRFAVLVDQWDAIKKMAQGQEVISAVPSGVVELHSAEPCNNSCTYCREELREVTGKRFLSVEHMRKVIESVHKLNPRAPIKVSGIIGEPLLNTHMLEIFQLMNSKRMAWGLVTNGKIFRQGIIEELVKGAEYVNISVDAGSDHTYSGFGDELFMKNELDLAAIREEFTLKREIDERLMLNILGEKWRKKNLHALSMNQVLAGLNTVMEIQELDELVIKKDKSYFFSAHGEHKWVMFHDNVRALLDRKKAGESLRAAEQKALNREILKAAYPKGTRKSHGLKGGKPGDYPLVLSNIAQLVEKRNANPESHMRISISFLLDIENVDEIDNFVKDVIGLNPDSIEFKMEHYDERRVMTPDSVQGVYDWIRRLQAHHEGSHATEIRVIHSKETAVATVTPGARTIDFHRCFIGMLGNFVVTPEGIGKACCQYYNPILSSLGDIRTQSLEEIMNGPERREALQQDPREKCVMCAPADFAINSIVEGLYQAALVDKNYLQWVERNFIIPLAVKIKSPLLQRISALFVIPFMLVITLIALVARAHSQIHPKAKAAPEAQAIQLESLDLAHALDAFGESRHPTLSDAFKDLDGSASELPAPMLGILHARKLNDLSNIETALELAWMRNSAGNRGAVIVLGGGKIQEQMLSASIKAIMSDQIQSGRVAVVLESDLKPTESGRFRYEDVLNLPQVSLLGAVQQMWDSGKLIRGRVVVVAQDNSIFDISPDFKDLFLVIVKSADEWIRMTVDRMYQTQRKVKENA